MVVLTRQFCLPPRQDIPVVLVIALFHMVAFAAMMTAGLKEVPASRAVVLGYTTPLWVAPAAWFYLKEPLHTRMVCGIVLAVAGLFLLFDPAAFDWHDVHAVRGNSLILGAALCWSVSIVYTRAHHWKASPFQLVVWQTLLAAIALSLLAVHFEALPAASLSMKSVWALLFNGVVGTALGFWAMTVVNKAVPAAVASLGVLATPVVGLVLSVLVLGETLDNRLVLSSVAIVAGVALGTVPSRRALPAS